VGKLKNVNASTSCLVLAGMCMVFFMFPAVADATPVTYDFTITVNHVSGTLSGIGLGSHITGRFTADAGVWLQHNANADWMGYALTQAYLDLGSGPHNLLYTETFGTNGLGVYQEKIAPYSSAFGITTYPAYNGQSLALNLVLRGTSVFTDVSTLGPLNLSDFSSTEFSIWDLYTINGLSTETGKATGIVSGLELVPEPSTIVLLGMGLVGLIVPTSGVSKKIRGGSHDGHILKVGTQDEVGTQDGQKSATSRCLSNPKKT
jgi:hypothetical protein